MSIVLIDVVHAVVAVSLLFGPVVAMNIADRPRARRL